MCPFLDQADPQCAVHWSLSKLEDAMGRCGTNYEECPVYREKLLGNAPRDEQAVEPAHAAG